MTNITVEAINKFGEDRKFPLPSYRAYLTAEKVNDWAYAVKPIYEHPRSGTSVDYDKPLRAYLKLNTKDKGKDMECLTIICNSDGENIPPQKCVGVYGTYHLIVKWEGTYWGAHGGKSYGASIRLKVVEMDFTPAAAPASIEYAPSFRMLDALKNKRKNTP